MFFYKLLSISQITELLFELVDKKAKSANWLYVMTLFFQLSQQTGDASERSEERGSTTTSTSSSVNTGGRKGHSHFLLSPIPSSNKKSSRTQGHLEATKNLNNLPQLPKSRRYSTLNDEDNSTHVTSQVWRSVSTRDFRNLERREQLKFYAVDDQAICKIIYNCWKGL